MPFVKLDTGILDSTLWVDRPAREVFLTALLMAEPYETAEPSSQIEIRSLRETGFVVPPGRYGFVRAAGIGIIRRAGLADGDEGLAALERLGSPEADSRTPDFEGRRLVRVDGGFLVLNFDRYRRTDYTAAARQQRHRARHAVTPLRHAVTPRYVTQAEAEVETTTTDASRPRRSTSDGYPEAFERTFAIYPRRAGGNPKRRAFRAWSARLRSGATADEIHAGVERYASFCDATGKTGSEFVKQAATFFGPDEHFREPWSVGNQGARDSYLKPADLVADQGQR